MRAINSLILIPPQCPLAIRLIGAGMEAVEFKSELRTDESAIIRDIETVIQNAGLRADPVVFGAKNLI